MSEWTYSSRVMRKDANGNDLPGGALMMNDEQVAEFKLAAICNRAMYALELCKGVHPDQMFELIKAGGLASLLEAEE